MKLPYLYKSTCSLVASMWHKLNYSNNLGNILFPSVWYTKIPDYVVFVYQAGGNLIFRINITFVT